MAEPLPASSLDLNESEGWDDAADFEVSAYLNLVTKLNFSASCGPVGGCSLALIAVLPS